MSLETAAQAIEDNGPDPRYRVVTPWAVILSNLATVVDTAAGMAERGDIAHDEIDDVARSICERIVTRAAREQRAVHTWWHGGHTMGEESPVTAAPDVHERVRAATRKVRTNKGATVDMVSVHGRAYVVGRLDVTPNASHAMSADRARHMLDTVPRAAIGHDAISLYRATQALYGDTVPELIGGDVLSFEEFGAWDETRAATPRRGWPTRYRLTTVRRRAADDVRAGELLAPCDTGTARETVPATVERDNTGRVTGRTLPRTRVTTVPATRAFSGHRVIVRGDTVRQSRAARARRVDDALIIRERDDIAHVLPAIVAAVDRGDSYRATWTWQRDHRDDNVTGAVTVSPRGVFSVTGLPGTAQVKARTVDGLRAAIARSLATV